MAKHKIKLKMQTLSTGFYSDLYWCTKGSTLLKSGKLHWQESNQAKTLHPWSAWALGNEYAQNVGFKLKFQ